MSTKSFDAFPGFQVLARGCESRTVLDHVTGRWGTLILLALVLYQAPALVARLRTARQRVDHLATPAA